MSEIIDTTNVEVVNTDLKPKVNLSSPYDYVNNLATNKITSNTLVINPLFLFILVAIIIIIIAVFASLGSDQSGYAMENENYQNSVNVFGSLSLIILIFIIILGGLDYFYGTNVFASIKNIFGSDPNIDIILEKQNQENGSEPQPVSQSPQSSNNEQVFNIPGNYYGYEDAKSLCTAYGARLASYDEIENAYNDGAEWCNYGWSEGQMALFPTQESTFNKLQTIEGHENDCGRPGINGGYMKNSSVKYGVNCFGKKPAITPEEANLMSSTTPYPKTEKDIAMEERVEYWKQRLNTLLVSPFNYQTWSRY